MENIIQCWVCSNNGVRRYGESCNLNNNCKFPKCLNQVQVRPEEQLKNELEHFKNAYIERNDKCNELQSQKEELEKELEHKTKG